MIHVKDLKDLKAESDLISEEESCMNEVTEVEASQVQGGAGCSWNAHTGPYVRDPINYPSPPPQGICGVNMSCSNGCGSIMSCG